MLDFQYYTPTQVVFGRGAEDRAGELLRAHGAHKVLIHYGGGSVVRSGLLARVIASVEAAGIAHVELGGVVPNPRLSKVREGIALCRREGVDFLLAVGGGSVLDSAKAIGYGLVYEGDVWDFYCRKAQPAGSVPVGCIITIAAAGSEMSNSSVITNEEGWLKRGCLSDHGRCRFALMNPELTYTLPVYQTMSGVADILMHTMERFFSPEDGLALTDSLGLGLLRTVMQSAPVLLTRPDDYQARAEILWASSLSHNGLTGCGLEGDWACHQLEHELGGMFDVAHGAGLAAVWGSWARYVYKRRPGRFAQFAVEALGVADEGDAGCTALAGIEAMEAFFRRIGMPTDIAGLGVTVEDAQIEEMARKCTFEGTRTVGSFCKLGHADIVAIYAMARGG